LVVAKLKQGVFKMKKFAFVPVLLATYLLALLLPVTAQQSVSGIVGSINKAPVSPDGDVVGAATDFVINLAVDMNPSEPGKMLSTGESIRIKLPDVFVFADRESYPVQNVFGAANCKPGILKCSTGVLLQGWPQHPILPSFPPGKATQYALSFEPASNTIIYTAHKRITDVPLPGPGIKQAHLILLGFRNPKEPGTYPIRVDIIDASGNERESGVGNLIIRPDPAPSINVTSVFVPNDENGGNPPNPNTIYQKTKVGEAAAMPWDFLVWDTDGKPYAGLEIVQKNGDGGTLVHSGKVVGRFSISSPQGATGQKVSGGPSVALPSTPVIGKSFGEPIPVGRLTASFTAGSKPGRYFTTFELNDGNSVTMVVDVTTGS
jgi:hypothetical protein